MPRLFSHSLPLRAFSMFNHGPHLRGAAPPPEDAGFTGAMEVAAKATLVKAALDTAVPMAADGLARMCPHRARKEDEKYVDKLEISLTMYLINV